MIDFLNNYNLKILEDTFYRTMYKNSPELGKNLLFCKRKSFNKYIHNSKPYYSRIEIINLARNMGQKINLESLSEDDINKLCDYVSSNDITADILLEHQKYIVSKNLLGLIQYYTITGSANLNAYLRNPNSIQNNTFDEMITNLTNLCLSAPAFDNDYIVYRFVKNDNYLQYLKMGDIYTENSFMSTTRDPFYRSNTYSFGFILLKISIPKNKPGIALCLEGCSHFPEEQEIIFPPGSQFKLTARNEDITYYHTDLNYTSKIQTKYEFKWVGYKDLKQPNRQKDNLPLIDFLDTKPTTTITLTERIKNFRKSLSDTSRALTKIGDKEFTIIGETYNSTGAYKNFFAITTNNGYSIYSIYDNYLLFMIEIGTVNDIDEMRINFYVKYNTLNKEQIITNTEFITLISEIGYYFSVDKIVIYSEYKPCFTFNNDNPFEVSDIYIYSLVDTYVYKYNFISKFPYFIKTPLLMI